MTNILDGKKVSEEIKLDLIKRINKEYTLAVLQVGDNDSSNIYINNKRKLCESLHINFKHIKFENNIDEQTIINKIIELNNDKSINGIILQLPIPKQFNEFKILNTIDYKKDVDGLTLTNQALLLNNKKCIIPCTPRGIVTLLKYYNIEIEGKNIVIVGRSNLVGKPLFNYLNNLNGTVTLCHSKTKNLSSFTCNADILIVAVGKKDLITSEMVKENAVVIDVGINYIDNKIYGDVLFDEVSKKCSYISPVPKGIGPMTVISLIENIIETN